jgi:hypothetical protein
MSLTTKLRAGITASQTSPLDLGTPAFSLSKIATLDLVSGTGVGAADRIFTDTRTIAASGTDDLDLAGSLVDAFGATLTFVRVKGILVVAAAANTNNVVVGGAASNQFLTWVGSASDKVNVRPGGMLLLAATDATAYAVTAATGDLLRIANSSSGTSVTYDVVIVGCSA